MGREVRQTEEQTIHLHSAKSKSYLTNINRKEDINGPPPPPLS
jgi:hypothetical protein